MVKPETYWVVPWGVEWGGRDAKAGRVLSRRKRASPLLSSNHRTETSQNSNVKSERGHLVLQYPLLLRGKDFIQRKLLAELRGYGSRVVRQNLNEEREQGQGNARAISSARDLDSPPNDAPKTMCRDGPYSLRPTRLRRQESNHSSPSLSSSSPPQVRSTL